MNLIQRGIITLLKSSISGEAYLLPEGFSLEEALPEIQRHHIIPMCYDGALRCGLPRQHPVMKQLFQGYCQAMIKSEGQMREVARVCAAFDEQGIDYLPLKGCRMKALYPKPELRVMGDADILIRVEQRPEITRVMSGLGFENTENSDHELVWRSPSLYLELHKRLIPSYNKDFYAHIGDGWQLAKIKNGSCCAMTPEDEFVFLFTHFAKHYRGGGIGCRHVVDLWVFLRRHPELDEAYIKAEFDSLRLLDFYNNIRRVITLWFEDAPADEKSEFITDYIFSSGSYGLAERSALTNAVRSMRRSDNESVARLRYFLSRLFPPRETMLYKFPILDRHPWMLPLVWIYRPFYKLLFERYDIAKQRRFLGRMNQENLDSHRSALEYVGLDYNF